eukprot:TRINITY_DN3017_c3_g1_i2.p1 TRINITY_DN3017_c3_g1~~TRINITY_DN3017_c3_g1_i2.p1  ORF type:complete len:752 (-),score=133.12 TRINITY_DN3017_c3_g1_i2:323-2578(-)
MRSSQGPFVYSQYNQRRTPRISEGDSGYTTTADSQCTGIRLSASPAENGRRFASSVFAAAKQLSFSSRQTQRTFQTIDAEEEEEEDSDGTGTDGPDSVAPDHEDGCVDNVCGSAGSPFRKAVYLGACAGVLGVAAVWYGRSTSLGSSMASAGGSAVHAIGSALRHDHDDNSFEKYQRALRSSCSSVQSCSSKASPSNNSSSSVCTPLASQCAQRVKELMANPGSLRHLDPFHKSKGEQIMYLNRSTGKPVTGINQSDFWYPNYVPHEDWSFDEIQMMLHLHDGFDAQCPMPCFEDSWGLEADVRRRLRADDRRTEAGSSSPSKCPKRKAKPPPPEHPLAYNGMEWPEMCFEGRDEEWVLIIGDWGGVMPGVPARMQWRPPDKPPRTFVEGIDDQAQFLVAKNFNKRAKLRDPRYILNVGDNFYWGGCEENCFQKSVKENLVRFWGMGDKNMSGCPAVFYSIFETMYMGPGMDGKQWISCLGNHDYGGIHFSAGWDQQIVYTWGPSGRWVLPALYYSMKVTYPDIDTTIDYFILDTNIADTGPNTTANFAHNICGDFGNDENVSCAPHGPKDTKDCLRWFDSLWKEQVVWLEKKLEASAADWQIIMTHFPPEKCVPNPDFVDDLRDLGHKYGVDLVISGHRHVQSLFPSGYADWTMTAGIPYVVSGGGGGIMSDGMPHSYPFQYGYMEMKVTKYLITIANFDQDGNQNTQMYVHPRGRNAPPPSESSKEVDDHGEGDEGKKDDIDAEPVVPV